MFGFVLQDVRVMGGLLTPLIIVVVVIVLVRRSRARIGTSSILPEFKACGACGQSMRLHSLQCPRCGAAVPLEWAYRFSPWWHRFIATLFDWLLVTVPTSALLQALWVRDTAGNLVPGQPDLGPGIGFFSLVGLFFYFVVMEAKLGTTVGKMVFGAQVVDVNGGRIGWGRSLVRNIFKMLMMCASLLAPITLLCIVLSKRSQRIGDMVAGTMVVRGIAQKVTTQEGALHAEGVPQDEPMPAIAATSSSDLPASPRGASASPLVQPSYAQAAPRRGVAGFALSLVGFIMPVVWPFGLVLSWLDIRREKREGQPHGLSLAGLIVSAVGTVTVAVVLVALLAGAPVPLLSSLRDTTTNSAVKEGVHTIQAGIEAWAADHGGVYPDTSKVSRAGLADYVISWPENPYTRMPMRYGTERGDFYYDDNGSSYLLTGYGDDGKPIIQMP